MHETVDYEAVGLKVGLEVHQQLLTDRKLFCKCPAGLYTTEHDGTVLRHMRPTLSELGEYDGTALMEFKTKKRIIYLVHRSNACTYEMDDTPPFLINDKAVDVAIEQCLMLGCDIVDELHIARKQYLDGSIPTGFQRTAIVGMAGKLPFRGRELSVTQVSVEEDSCREVSDAGHLVVWRTDRLGMPLIETVTGPDLRTPAEVEEAILLVGRVCRGTGHVRVGAGASRQDVNVSVRGGRRVEIKGVSKASWARLLVHGEAIRQVNLLKLRDELWDRGFQAELDFRVEHRDVTELFAESALPYLRQPEWDAWLQRTGRRAGLEQGAGKFTVRAVKLPDLCGTLSWPGQPGLTFAHELQGRVRVIAGLDQQPVLLHSEDWPAEAAAELEPLRDHLGCQDTDSVALVWGADEDTVTAAQEILLRYVDATDGVPNETRQPFRDGHTDFERILPGPDRMYPDTDSPPQRIVRERVQHLDAALPDPPWVREDRYEAVGVPEPVAHFLVRRGGANRVDDVVTHAGADLRRACFFFGERVKGLRRDGVAVDDIAPDSWRDLFRRAHQQPALWQAWREVVQGLAARPSEPVAEILDTLQLGSEPEGWRESLRQLAAAEEPRWPDGTRDQRLRFLMGRAMHTLRGKVAAATVRGALNEELA